MKFNFLFVLVFLVCIASAFATVIVTSCTELYNLTADYEYDLGSNITCSDQIGKTAWGNNSVLDLKGFKLIDDVPWAHLINPATAVNNFTVKNGILYYHTGNKYVVDGANFAGTWLFDNLTFDIASTNGFMYSASGPSTFIVSNSTGNLGLSASAGSGVIFYFLNNNVTHSTSNIFLGDGSSYVYNNTIVATNNLTDSLFGIEWGSIFELIDNNITLQNISSTKGILGSPSKAFSKVIHNNIYSAYDLSANIHSRSDNWASNDYTQNYYNFTTIACGTQKIFTNTAGYNFTDTNASSSAPSWWVSGCGQTCYQCDGSGGVNEEFQTGECEEDWTENEESLVCEIECNQCSGDSCISDIQTFYSEGIEEAVCEENWNTEELTCCKTCYDCDCLLGDINETQYAEQGIISITECTGEYENSPPSCESLSCQRCNGLGSTENVTNYDTCCSGFTLEELICGLTCYYNQCTNGLNNITINASTGITNATCGSYYNTSEEVNSTALTCYRCIDNEYINTTYYGTCCSSWNSNISNVTCGTVITNWDIWEEMNMIGIIILLVALLITGEIFKNLILRVVFSLGIIAYSINQLTTTNGLFWFLGILLGALWFWRASMIYSSNE